jgi:hypothetical protein
LHQENADGLDVVLHGVNRSGTEYKCVQSGGIFDGPSDLASVAAIATWKVNAVRVPLNEACWLGINGAPAVFAGDNYKEAIASYVRKPAVQHRADSRAALGRAKPITIIWPSWPRRPSRSERMTNAMRTLGIVGLSAVGCTASGPPAPAAPPLAASAPSAASVPAPAAHERTLQA